MINKLRFHTHREIRVKITTPGEQRDLRKSGITPSDRKGPNKLDILLVRNILEYSLCNATCDFVYIFSQVRLMPALVTRTVRC
jgi:hypothetical protein